MDTLQMPPGTRGVRAILSGPFVVLAGLLVVLLGSGCDRLSSMGVTRVEARAAGDGIEDFLSYQEALIGRDADAVIEVFGKPKGVFERASGNTWMYSRWCVQFDAQGLVRRLERDIAASGGDARGGRPLALPSRPSPSVASPDSGSPSAAVTKVSNGGQTVDLNSLMPAGKIVVVDFYADWCGPCQRIAPDLQRMARENEDVVLVQVDIVKWGTPVTRQYGINSVPNIRVFDTNGKAVGRPTSSFTEVQSYVARAGG